MRWRWTHGVQESAVGVRRGDPSSGAPGAGSAARATQVPARTALTCCHTGHRPAYARFARGRVPGRLGHHLRLVSRWRAAEHRRRGSVRDRQSAPVPGYEYLDWLSKRIFKKRSIYSKINDA